MGCGGENATCEADHVWIIHVLVLGWGELWIMIPPLPAKAQLEKVPTTIATIKTHPPPPAAVISEGATFHRVCLAPCTYIQTDRQTDRQVDPHGTFHFAKLHKGEVAW